MSGCSRTFAEFISEFSEVLDVDGQRARQENGPFRAADRRLDSLLGPTARPAVEDDLGQTHGVFDTDAAVAEGARVLVEQFARRRIVQVDRMIVRKHEGEPPERVVVARQLADGQPSPDRLHLVAAAAERAELRARIPS